MKDLKEINVIDKEGNKITIKLITILKNTLNNRKFMLYTLDDNTDLVDIHACQINENNGESYLESIIDEEDWYMIQDVIRKLSKNYE